MKKIVIQVDPDLSDLIPIFLANKRSDVAAMLSASANEPIDFDALGRVGHRLKGEGGSYGFDLVSSYGALIERAAGERNVVPIRQYARELSTYLESVEIVYHQPDRR
jgi:HPt (histidine-containing phosphotransfer) domain-containing protein